MTNRTRMLGACPIVRFCGRWLFTCKTLKGISAIQSAHEGRLGVWTVPDQQAYCKGMRGKRRVCGRTDWELFAGVPLATEA